MRRVSRAEVAAASERPSIPPPVRPDLERPDLGQPASFEEMREDTDSRPIGRSDSGRFRMPRAAINKAPVVRSSAPQQVNKPENEGPAEPPPRRRVMPSVGGGSMDDLFGAAAQMGRVSLRSSTPEDEEEDE